MAESLIAPPPLLSWAIAGSPGARTAEPTPSPARLAAVRNNLRSSLLSALRLIALVTKPLSNIGRSPVIASRVGPFRLARLWAPRETDLVSQPSWL